MATRLVAVPAVRVRHAGWDALFVMFSFVHAAALVLMPSMAVVGIGMWWNANTISHNFIHRPFFRSRWANRAFSLHLTLLLGVPQTFWRERHLVHHGGRSRRVRFTPAMAIEVGSLAALWTTLALFAPRWLMTVYVPGYALGMILSSLFLLWGREAWHTATLFQEPIYLASGFYFPIRELGPLAGSLAAILPITLGLDGIRQILYGKAAHGFVPLVWIPPIQVVLLVLFLYLAHRSLATMERLGKQEGRLTLRGA